MKIVNEYGGLGLARGGKARRAPSIRRCRPRRVVVSGRDCNGRRLEQRLLVDGKAERPTQTLCGAELPQGRQVTHRPGEGVVQTPLGARLTIGLLASAVGWK
jgi:hypothetical protein